MNEQQSISPRHRLQELLAIPERQRTDAQWDEINELEIALASVNRLEAREPSVRRNAPVPATISEGPRLARKAKSRPRSFTSDHPSPIRLEPGLPCYNE